MRVVLIGCVEAKALPPTPPGPHPPGWTQQRLPAKDLYVSPLFRKRRAYAEREVRAGRADLWAIVSALFKCVPPDKEIPGYEMKMSNWRKGELDFWGSQVAITLHRDVLRCEHELDGLVVEIHAGAAYVDPARPYLERRGCIVETPLAGLQIGEQLGWYNRATTMQMEMEFA